MSMHFADIAEQAMAQGTIGAEEILALRAAGWADGQMDPEEAESLFIANDHLAEPSAEWVALFVEALSEFVVNTVTPAGYVDQEMADELVSRIDHDGRILSRAELELLVRIFEKASSVPPSLKAYALRQIEDAVTTDEGPTRSEDQASHAISAEETDLLRRFLFAPGGEGPATIGKGEAELLFRIKDATLYEANAPEWERLFVQGVANYLFAFGGSEPLSTERVMELEEFMATDGAGIGSFLIRMMHSEPKEAFASLLSFGEDEVEGDDEAEPAQFTEEEQNWLQDRLEADEDLDDLEKALIAYIAEETGEVFGMKV